MNFLNDKNELSHLRVLIVEDVANMRRILRNMLTSFRVAEIFEAVDGPSGLDSFMRSAPDVVITDSGMPGFDGIELVKFIRSPDVSLYTHTPIIYLSERPTVSAVLNAHDAGVNEVLAKPVSYNQLRQRLLSIICNPRAFIKTETYFGPEIRKSKVSSN